MVHTFRKFAARVAAALLAGLLVAALPSTSAEAAKVSVKDAAGDYPDIVAMTGNNAKKRLVMTVRFGDASVAYLAASAYVRSGKRVYQAFDATAGGSNFRELRFKGKKVPCRGLKVARNVDRATIRITIPRKCTPKLRKKVQFKAVATEGTMSADETKWSKKVNRG